MNNSLGTIRIIAGVLTRVSGLYVISDLMSNPTGKNFTGNRQAQRETGYQRSEISIVKSKTVLSRVRIVAIFAIMGAITIDITERIVYSCYKPNNKGKRR